MEIKSNLNLLEFEKAINILGEALEKNDKHDLKKQFVHTYNLALDTIRCHLIESSGSPDEIMHFGFEQLMRAAYAASLVSEELIVWKKFQKYCHDVDTSAKIVRTFLDELRYFLSQLKGRAEHLE